MRIHDEELSEISRYLKNLGHVRLEDKEPQFRSYLRAVERYRKLTPSDRILEIGTGTGWFPLLCAMNNIQCKGLEISPTLIEHAREWGRKYGLEPDIELGNIEESDVGDDEYDVIIASSVFEHVERWRPALKRVYQALRPGGVLFFESTNKFSLTSGECHLPLYGWLPDAFRYWLRRRIHGDDIMKLGIDFNQFTYWGLRREFRSLGFSQVHDRIDAADSDHVSAAWKRRVVLLAKKSRVVKAVSLTFADVTRFLCVK